MRLGRRRTPTLLLALTLLAARAHVASALPPVLGPETWTQVEPGFGPRYGHSLTYDPVGHRLILFGGSRFTSGLDRFLSDVWELDLDGGLTWRPLHPLGTAPPGREFHTAVYDAANQRILIHGGDGDHLTEN